MCAWSITLFRRRAESLQQSSKTPNPKAALFKEWEKEHENESQCPARALLDCSVCVCAKHFAQIRRLLAGRRTKNSFVSVNYQPLCARFSVSGSRLSVLNARLKAPVKSQQANGDGLILAFSISWWCSALRAIGSSICNEKKAKKNMTFGLWDKRKMRALFCCSAVTDQCRDKRDDAIRGLRLLSPRELRASSSFVVIVLLKKALT